MTGDPRREAAARAVLRYHQESKHQLRRFAPGPGWLDWETQPEPFRAWAGATRHPLPLPDPLPETPAGALHGHTPASPAAVNQENISRLLALSLGLSAWKSYLDVRWSLRCNPSSGNLHPTEGYLATPRPLGGIPPGVWHYHPHDHCLEQRHSLTGAAAATLAPLLPETGLLLGLTTIPWREMWKYGARAYRYCQLDVGHALGAVRYAAAVLGWRVLPLHHLGDGVTAALLGLTGEWGEAEPEAPDLLLWISPAGDAHPTLESGPWEQAAAMVAAGPWRGTPQRLSPPHQHRWPQVMAVTEAARMPPETPPTPWPDPSWTPPDWPPPLPEPALTTAAALIRQRRSGHRYDGLTPLPREGFQRLLERLLPRPGRSPWDLWPRPPRVHPLFLVHRVTGVVPGLYLLVRHPDDLERLRAALDAAFLWQPVAGFPPEFPLHQLRPGDFRQQAGELACRQEIARDGALAVAMLAPLEAALGHGPWHYRQLLWEAGMVGQALYLGAEAEGVRGTGIGCFFDDPLHQLLGIGDTAWQALYQFSVGTPLADDRLVDEPPYLHLAGRG